MKLRAIVLVSAAWVFTGCVSSGTDFPSDTNWIRISKTKKSDVAMVLGEPDAVGSSSGVRTWSYLYYRYALFGSPRHKELKFYWGGDQTVQNYSFTSSFQDDVKSEAKPKKAESATKQRAAETSLLAPGKNFKSKY